MREWLGRIAGVLGALAAWSTLGALAAGSLFGFLFRAAFTTGCLSFFFWSRVRRDGASDSGASEIQLIRAQAVADFKLLRSAIGQKMDYLRTNGVRSAPSENTSSEGRRCGVPE